VMADVLDADGLATAVRGMRESGPDRA